MYESAKMKPVNLPKQYTYVKMLSIINHENIHQNYNDIPSHCNLKGYYVKTKQKMLTMMWRIINTHILLLGMSICAVITQNTTDTPENTVNRTTA